MKSNRDQRQLPRRDKLWCAAMRMARLNDIQRAVAWRSLAGRIGDLSEKDVPKFDDLYRAIRGATIEAKQARIIELTELYGNQTQPTEGPEAA